MSNTMLFALLSISEILRCNYVVGKKSIIKFIHKRNPTGYTVTHTTVFSIIIFRKIKYLFGRKRNLLSKDNKKAEN